MKTHTLTDHSHKKRSTFSVAFTICGIIAFIQLMLMGVALATRIGETRIVTETIESPPEVFYIPTLSDKREAVTAKVQPRDYATIMKEHGNSDIDIASLVYEKRAKRSQRGVAIEIKPSATQSLSKFGAIQNTQVEKLVEDAQGLHLEGDVVRAILKLDEAELIDPEEPAIIYRRALIYEDMRNWERATDAYAALFALGPETGYYYEIASDKIANGVKESPDIVPFQLGNIVQRVSKDKLNTKVTIPVRRITEQEYEPSNIEIRIFFYDIVDNKTIQAVPQQREQNISKSWISGVADWTETIEESILAEYQLPVLDRADVHLFGDRKYFGNVIELYYKGELMDQYATPGRLHGIHAQEQFKHQIQPDFLPYDLLDEDYDGTELLLPEIDN